MRQRRTRDRLQAPARGLGGLVLAWAALLALAACGPRAAPVAGRVAPAVTTGVAPATLPARTATPTLTPTATSTPRPTATWVPLITPSATPGEKVPTRADVPRVGVAEARAMVDAGEAVFVDVRGEAVYALSHIAGAISLPPGEAAQRYTQLPAGKLPIFYCA